MPIFIYNYYWKQNDKKIHVTIPVKNVQRTNLNIFSTEKYIKLNFPPNIFELVLYGIVQSNKSKCIVKPGEVILELVKKVPGYWPRLSENIEKKELVDVKQEIIENVRKISATEKEANKKSISERTHFLRDCQMSLYKEEKQKIQSLKDEQKKNAIQEIVAWKSESSSLTNTASFSIKPGLNKDAPLPVPTPFPRESSIISFSFTPRLLPTPKRESKTAEEEEWLRKQAEAIRLSGFVAADLSEDEKDPIWLLNKGRNFLENSNYLGALNVFEYATKMSPKMSILYVKLAETLNKLNRYQKAVDKATVALELLTPVVRQNKNLRAEAYRIRAEAYLKIGEKRFSEADYKESELLLE